jgi:hypothetical protein
MVDRGVHAHKLCQAGLRGYLRTAPRSAGRDPLSALVANHSHGSGIDGAAGTGERGRKDSTEAANQTQRL